MNNTNLQEAVQSAVKSKFRGRASLKCRTVPRYPDTAEREMKRLTNAIMRIANEELKKRLPEIMREYKKAMRRDSRMDGVGEFDKFIRKVFEEIAIAISERIDALEVSNLISKVSNQARNNSIREWKRAVKNTVGIDILEDYYKGTFYSDMIQKWVDENVSKIKSIPADTLDAMRTKIFQGYSSGETITTLQKEIQKEYTVTKHKAQMLARDQIGTLNAQITEAQQRDAGVSKYVWLTAHDRRVRPCHASFDGKVFSWDNPPEIWYETKSKGRIYTGRRCHPSADYCCRCVAIPVFEYKTINVPMAGDKK